MSRETEITYFLIFTEIFQRCRNTGRWLCDIDQTPNMSASTDGVKAKMAEQKGMCVFVNGIIYTLYETLGTK